MSVDFHQCFSNLLIFVNRFWTLSCLSTCIRTATTRTSTSVIDGFCSTLKEVSVITVFDLIGARGTYVNLFSTSSAKRSSSG